MSRSTTARLPEGDACSAARALVERGDRGGGRGLCSDLSIPGAPHHPTRYVATSAMYSVFYIGILRDNRRAGIYSMWMLRDALCIARTTRPESAEGERWMRLQGNAHPSTHRRVRDPQEWIYGPPAPVGRRQAGLCSPSRLGKSRQDMGVSHAHEPRHLKEVHRLPRPSPSRSSLDSPCPPDSESRGPSP